MKRDTAVPYICLNVQLHGCVNDPGQLRNELEAYLRDLLDPDFTNDIEVEISKSPK